MKIRRGRITAASEGKSDKGYFRALAEGVVKEYNDYYPSGDLIYDITDKTITFADNGSVIYTQLVSDITPNIDDLQDDIRQLADDVIAHGNLEF